MQRHAAARRETHHMKTETAKVPPHRRPGGRIAFLLPTLEGGGAERVVLNLLKEMSAAGIPLDLVLVAAHGAFLDQIPETVRVVDLHSQRVAGAVMPLCRYLRQSRPSVLISNMSHVNTIACLAKMLTRNRTAVICVEHAQFGDHLGGREKAIRGLARWLYPTADAVVAVSRGAALSVETAIKAMRGKVHVIYPPVVDEALLAEAEAPLEHPWLDGEIPVFLTVCRLSAQKDFSTLLNAFQCLRRQRQARLLILGEGPSREALEAQVSALDLSEDVAMPGFTPNPYAYMRRADAFVLSSRSEGLGLVLIEAMACGCPVVATDCPSGPREILEGGRFGALVPVGDAAALSGAMCRALDAPLPAEQLRRRAMDFSAARAAKAFLDLAAHLTGTPGGARQENC